MPAITCQETAIGMSVWLGIEQEQRADREGDDAAEPEHAEAGAERLRHHQADAEEQQRQPGELTGSTDSAVSATIRQMPPTTPGATAPGLQNSNRMP